MTGAAPTDAIERALRAAGHRRIAGLDECGRGSYAGPVCVGAVIAGDTPPPAGLADSKKLTSRRRAALVPAIHEWAAGVGVGLASAVEIDERGMAAALKLAAERALAALPFAPDVAILDGPHDYLRRPGFVHPHVKADLTELVVSAASIVAKEHRDALMRDLDAVHPGYDFASNAGYLSPKHLAALQAVGPCNEHRTSWKFMNDLPAWAHLRRGPAAAQPSLF